MYKTLALLSIPLHNLKNPRAQLRMTRLQVRTCVCLDQRRGSTKTHLDQR
jgi:hypothetical protein